MLFVYGLATPPRRARELTSQPLLARDRITGPSDGLISFLKMCAAVFPDLTVAQARRRVLRQKTTLPLPPRCRRRHHSSEARAQILVDEEVAKQDPVGVEALTNFADSDTAAVAFDDIQAAPARDILSEFGKKSECSQKGRPEAGEPSRRVFFWRGSESSIVQCGRRSVMSPQLRQFEGRVESAVQRLGWPVAWWR